MIKINILDFFKTGNFDCVRLGQTKDQILAHFASPDEVWNNNNGGEIWSYGIIEFHFFEDELYTIFSDDFQWEKLNGGKSIELDRWIFERPRRLSLKNVLSELNLQHIDYQKKQNQLGAILLVLPSGVTLHFENHKDLPDLDPNKFRLEAFYISSNLQKINEL